MPPFKTLQAAIDAGGYKPRGGNGAERPSRPAAGGWRRRKPEESAAPAAAPIGNGSERDKSLLAGVIVEELDKEIQALVFAKEVIQRRFQKVG